MLPPFEHRLSYLSQASGRMRKVVRVNSSLEVSKKDSNVRLCFYLYTL